MNCFAIGILVFAFFAIIHVMYDRILLPSIRMHFRFKLFALRDDLRMKKLVHGNSITDELYASMEGSINNAIKLLPVINVHMMVTSQEKLASNEELKELIERRRKLLEECPVEEIRSIRANLLRETALIFAFNSGMWFMYLLPVGIAMVFLGRLKLAIKKLIYMPAPEIDSFVAAEACFA